ncbi:hypothetical protein BgiBS90_000035, partial [Biomphalaria glabrata]
QLTSGGAILMPPAAMKPPDSLAETSRPAVVPPATRRRAPRRAVGDVVVNASDLTGRKGRHCSNHSSINRMSA